MARRAFGCLVARICQILARSRILGTAFAPQNAVCMFHYIVSFYI